jgi:hypothetical protein
MSHISQQTHTEVKLALSCGSKQSQKKDSSFF